MGSEKTSSDIRKDNENVIKNVTGVTAAIATIITVSLAVNFLIVPNIPVPIPTIPIHNLSVTIPESAFNYNGL